MGESPLWDEHRERLVFIDGPRGHIRSLADPIYSEQTTCMPFAISAVALRADRGLIVASDDRVMVVDGDGLGRTVARSGDGLRFNDGKCDALGRLWIGTVSVPLSGRAAHLFRIDPDGRVESVVGGIGMSNGLAWSVANDRFYYVDTPTQRVDAFDFDLESGRLSHRRPFAVIPPELGMPDGLTVDSRGGVWVAVWGGGVVLRFTPDGQLERRLTVPASQVTSCAFGGPGLEHLFVTTAAAGLPEHAREGETFAGHTFRVDAGFSGVAAHSFDHP